MRKMRLTESTLSRVVRQSLKRVLREDARVIYNEEGMPIGESEDGRICWYYSDGAAGGSEGGHYMDTAEFLRYNKIPMHDDEDWF